MSTIAAISSPIGAGGIGIVRVSGKDALNIADTIFSFAHKGKHSLDLDGVNQGWVPLHMHFGTFNANEFCDKGYAVYFPAKNAYTGEDTVEFYLHGGVRIMQGALDTLLSKGAVMAQNGEFTKRAFLNGRLSLADAEGVIDMINAESVAGVRAAYRLMDGSIAKAIDDILEALETLIATLEATLDYPDEMEDEVLPTLDSAIGDIYNKVVALLSTRTQGKYAKHGINVVLAGNTNAGKSSIMNALLKEDRAIVTSIAGTTRDTVEDSFECDGVRVNLVDTAGIRDSDDIVESIGIERAKKAFESADVILHIIDKNDNDVDWDFHDKLVFEVYNKCDIYGFNIPRKMHTYAVSAKTGEGIDNLRHAIASLYKENKVNGGEIITAERHISALYQAKLSLESAILSINDTIDCTLIDLRSAYDALGEITGRTAKEDVVNSIFSRFCVGK